VRLLDGGEMQIETSYWQLTNHRYCRRCSAEIGRELVKGSIRHSLAWCEKCHDVVGVSRCRVSYWFVTAIIVVAWADIFVNIFR
jgi:hypothetical protein